MSLSGIYKNTKSLSGVNTVTNDIANLYLNNLNVTLDVSNLIVSNVAINNKLSNLISSNLTVFGLVNDLSNAYTTAYGHISMLQANVINLQLGNVTSHTKVTNLENANINLQLGNVTSHTKVTNLENANINLQLGNVSAHTQLIALQNANINLQLGNVSAHTQLIALSSNLTGLSLANINLQLGNASAHNQIIALQNANVNLQLGNASSHNQIIALQNANVNLQLGNLSSHTRITTLESKTQLLSSNATVSNIAGNLMITDTITIFGNANITNGMLVLPNNTLVLPNLQAFTGTTTSGTITVSASSTHNNTELAWYALNFKLPPATIRVFSSSATYDLSTGNYTGSVSTTLLNGTTYTGEWWQMFNTSPFIPYTININALFTSTAKEYYFLGSKTGTNGSWVLLQSSTTYNAGSLTMDNVSFPMNYLRIVCNKVQPGTNPAFFYIAYITMIGGSGGNMRIDGYVMGDLRMYNGNINTSTGLITGGMGLVAGGDHGTRLPTSQSGYMSWNFSGGGAETDFWTIQPNNSFWEGFRWYVRTLSPVTQTQIMTLTKSGWLGLNRTNPQFPLDINGQFNSIAYGQPSAGKYFSRNVGLTNMGSSNNFNCSICCTGSIWINSFSGNSLDNSFVSGNSDRRIKENIKEIDGEDALEKIRKLRPVYYDYIDRYENGLQNIGYIAQEVKEIIPQSVDDKYKNFIPNVFTFGKWYKNLINFDKPHGLKGEGKIQVVLQKHDKRDYLYEEKEEWEYTVQSSKVLKVSKETLTETKIFVYGSYIQDFHVLGDKFINIIGISAIKELDKRLSRLEKLLNKK